MPLPSTSISFDTAKVPAGLVIEGLAKTRKAIKSPDGEMIEPIAGARFLCLDDPEAIDARRMRLNPLAAARFDGLRVRSPRSGVPTLAADGARLLCRDVSLQKGKRLTFAWQLLVWGEMPWNDFATFEAVPDIANGYGVPRSVLCDLAELALGRRRASDWRTATWTLTSDFAGTLMWTVANGQEVNDPAISACADEAFSNPAALLIDEIRVRG